VWCREVRVEGEFGREYVMERGNRSSGRYYGPEGGEEADHREYRHRRSSYQQFFPMFRIRDILLWIRIRGSMPLTNGSLIDLKTPTKNKFFLKLILF
jgi:hypothetical protein